MQKKFIDKNKEIDYHDYPTEINTDSNTLISREHLLTE